VARLELVEHRDDTVDVGVLVVEAVERVGEVHRVAGRITLIELLSPRKGRHRGVEGEAETVSPSSRQWR